MLRAAFDGLQKKKVVENPKSEREIRVSKNRGIECR